MNAIATVVSIVIALGIFNVWIVRAHRATPYRPEGAGDLAEEFRRYGLPGWAHGVVGAAKITLALLLLAGIFYPPLAVPAAIGMALLMLGAILAHVRVSDPWVKAMPATLMLALSTVVVLSHTA